MAASSPGSSGTARPEPPKGSTSGTPRWVKRFGIVAAALVLLFVILHLTGLSPGHDHMRHADAAVPGGHQP